MFKFLILVTLYRFSQILGATPEYLVRDVDLKGIVSLQLLTLHRSICCGGLVSLNVVVTTAHCAQLTIPNYKGWHVVAGLYHDARCEEVIQNRSIAAAIIHPDSESSAFDHPNSDNVGLLLLVTPFNQSNFVAAFDSFGKEVIVGDKLSVCSAKKENGDNARPQLEVCIMFEVLEPDACAKSEPGKNLCLNEDPLEYKVGENGTPAFSEEELVGLRSSDNVFIHLAFYTQWIKGIIRTSEINAEDGRFRSNADRSRGAKSISFNIFNCMCIFSFIFSMNESYSGLLGTNVEWRLLWPNSEGKSVCYPTVLALCRKKTTVTSYFL